ncbi:MAG: AAA family ATPase, partial [Parcubacteria group bacterium]|nr:AAA family ATPase [Parcubacteria group bacterium]
MELTRFEITNFRRFEEAIFEFAPTLTVIRGENEKGKSTILAALAAVFFADPSSRSKAIETYRRWGATELPTLSLAFREGEEVWTLTKGFEKRETLLVSAHGETVKDGRSIEARLTPSLGMGSVEVFMHSIAVGQGQVALSELSDRTALTRALQDAITSGGGANIVELIARVSKYVASCKVGLSGPAKNPGRVATLRVKTTHLNEELEKAVSRLSSIAKRKETIAILEKAEAEQEQERVTKHTLLTLNETYHIAARDLATLTKEYDELSSFAVRRKELEANLTRIITALEPLKEYRDTMFVTETLRTLSKETPPLVQHGGSILIPIVLVVLVTGGLALTVHPFWWWGTLLAVLAGLLAWRRFAPPQQGDAASSHQHQAKLDEFHRKHKEFLELDRERQGIERALEVLTKNRDQDAVATRLTELTREINLRRDTMKEMPEGTLVEPEKMVALRATIVKHEGRLKELTSRLSAERALLADAETEASHEAVTRLTEELADAKEELAREETRLAIFERVLLGFTEAKENAFTTIHPILIKAIAEHLPILTNGRYRELALANDLEVSVYSDEYHDHVVPEEHLSYGTVDQIYLAARFAIARFLAGGRKTFLILDDPFVNFDLTRLVAAKHLLKDFAKEFQVILMTTGEEFDSI